jgi:hypothetical protein
MYIYENLAAVEKGICLEKRCCTLDDSSGARVVRLDSFEDV